MAELTHTDLREQVRRRYAAAAKAVPASGGGCCGGSGGCGAAQAPEGGFGSLLYTGQETEGAPPAAREASLGCGVPTAVADLHEGETVLDLGSGAGADVLISARRVGPRGKAIGVDMTDEMLAAARRHAAEAGVGNAEFVKGYIEELPLPDESVDVVVSNCVINLSADKAKVIREAARVLRAGGRFAVSDIVADEDMDPAIRTDLEQWTGCIAGALTRAEFERELAESGLVDVEVHETHRVHEHAASAIVRARKPERNRTRPTDDVAAEAGDRRVPPRPRGLAGAARALPLPGPTHLRSRAELSPARGAFRAGGRRATRGRGGSRRGECCPFLRMSLRRGVAPPVDLGRRRRP
jgi:arsenite methyltransferase